MRERRSISRPALAVVLALCVLPGAAGAQGSQAGDAGPRPLFDQRDAWIAAAYVGGAALSFPFDERVAMAIRDSVFQESRGLKPAARAFNFLGFPGSLLISAVVYGGGLAAGSHDVSGMGLHMGEAIMMAEGFTYAIKTLAGRARPALDIHAPFNFRLARGIRGSPYQSFPSGHSTAAFATAAAAAHELRNVWPGHDILVGMVTYGAATMVGLSRMFDNRHWTSDVVFGAAIGAFSGWKVVRYNDEHPGNRLNQWLLVGSFVPGRGGGLAVGLLPAM